MRIEENKICAIDSIKLDEIGTIFAYGLESGEIIVKYIN